MTATATRRTTDHSSDDRAEGGLPTTSAHPRPSSPLAGASEPARRSQPTPSPPAGRHTNAPSAPVPRRLLPRNRARATVTALAKEFGVRRSPAPLSNRGPAVGHRKRRRGCGSPATTNPRLEPSPSRNSRLQQRRHGPRCYVLGANPSDEGRIADQRSRRRAEPRSRPGASPLSPSAPSNDAGGWRDDDRSPEVLVNSAPSSTIPDTGPVAIRRSIVRSPRTCPRRR